ncbi:MAG: HIRAN domain-containing protein [Xenococcaceae cyanobacterium]
MKTLFLAWQDSNSRKWFPIGRLTFDGNQYQFVYIQGIKQAQDESNFQPLHSFPDFNKIYTSDELFPLFSNRLMRRSRPDYKDYIEWLNIPKNEDDPIAILSRTGGSKATDHFEIFPCPELDENGLYHIHFFARGLRYFPECARQRINDLEENETLFLLHDLQNKYDPQALVLRTEDRHEVGYCPRYLVDDVFEMLRQNPEFVHVYVERVNPAPSPLQFRLLCNLTAEWKNDFRPFSNPIYQPLVTDFSTTIKC